MGVRLSQVLNETRKLAHPVGDGVLTIVYRPRYVTPALQDELSAMIGDQKLGRACARMLARTIVSWDLEGDDGKPVPIDEELMCESIPSAFLLELVSTINADVSPGETTGATSAGG